jgi:DnaJ like chaperone protein
MIFILFGGFKTIFLLIPIIFVFLPVILIGVVFISLVRTIAKNNGINSGLQGSSVSRTKFVELFTRMLIHLAKADGKVDQSEIQAIRQYFQIQLRFGTSQLNWVDDIIKAALQQSYSIDELCRECAQNFDHSTHLLLLELLYHIANADGHISSSETSLIENIIKQLGISDFEHKQVKAKYNLKSSNDDYYTVLEISKGASPEEIKKAYKNCAKKYHPDTVQHLGPDFKRVAEEKFKKITEAYNYLKK